MKNEYWFYLETYVFIWDNPDEILVYNTISGKGYVYKNTPELSNIIADLEDKNNLYCISISEKDLNCQIIHDFIFSIRDNFCGDLINKSYFKQKPLVVIPELNVNDKSLTDTESLKRNLVSDVYAVKNLLEVTIYLTGICNFDCKDCFHAYQQITWCHKNKNILPKELLFNILYQIINTSVCEVKFLGGNVFSYPFWDELINELKKYSFKKSFYSDFRLLTSDPKQLEIFNMIEFFLYILVDVSDNMEQIICENISIHSEYNYIFKIKSIEEYEIAKKIIDHYQIESKIIPFFDGANLQFFKLLLVRLTVKNY